MGTFREVSRGECRSRVLVGEEGGNGVPVMFTCAKWGEAKLKLRHHA